VITGVAAAVSVLSCGSGWMLARWAGGVARYKTLQGSPVLLYGAAGQVPDMGCLDFPYTASPKYQRILLAEPLT
jgi:hypothetical protein